MKLQSLNPPEADNRFASWLHKFIPLVCMIFFFLTCYKTYDIKGQFPIFNLSLIDSLRLANPIASLGLDADGGILLLEVSGTKILLTSNNLIVVDSIILPEKIFYPKGISADEFFIYIYNDNNLYRFDRQNRTLKSIFSGIRPKGMAVVNANEIYLSDPQNNRIVVVDATGRALDFLKQTPTSEFEPTGLAYDKKNGTLWVINNQNQAIESYNRIGNLKARITIFNYTFDKISIGEDDNIYLIGKNGQSVWRIDRKGEFKLYQGSNFVATDLLLGKDRIYILDYQNRILSFKIPH
jgi:DNA-binding beta-propeller fold protein YncE